MLVVFGAHRTPASRPLGAFSPTLFVNGERYQGELDPAAVLAALQPSR
jgi:hypothetical protein